MFGGAPIASFGGHGSADGQFVSPREIALAPDGSVVYVVDKGNHRVEVSSQACWEVSGVRRSLAVPHPRVHRVTDACNPGCVQVFTLGGEYVACIGGQKGSLLHQLNRPWGLAVSSDLLFVSDRLNNCVKVWWSVQAVRAYVCG
jgi:DNA-binding beta-propeller fold protein YncE